MTGFWALVKRNTRLFFKDKGMFITAMISPLILLFLYATFLGQVYEDTFLSALPEGMVLKDEIISALVGGQLISSLLAVSCVTVSFCSNMLSIQDKVTGALRDLTVSPVKRGTLALSYYVSSAFSSLIVCLITAGAGLLYLYSTGWYLSASDVALLFCDVVLLVLFGTALSSVIHHFLSTDGQMSAVGTIISAGYGFLCGAYMPISQFNEGLRNVISLLPGTYGTGLVRNHALGGVFEYMVEDGVPAEAVDWMRDGIDCNLYFFGESVSQGTMYIVLGAAIVALLGLLIVINAMTARRRAKK
ncbi:MAG: ABC transporter permease [Clostridia bacterium]|nr:ABC transporter permease [Clostridia bacterium]